MNQQAAQALYAAAAAGVKQIKGHAFDPAGGPGRCAMGVLVETHLPLWRNNLRDHIEECPLCGTDERGDQEDCYIHDEADVIIHLNDFHGMTFSEIARKLGPDSV